MNTNDNNYVPFFELKSQYKRLKAVTVTNKYHVCSSNNNKYISHISASPKKKSSEMGKKHLHKVLKSISASIRKPKRPKQRGQIVNGRNTNVKKEMICRRMDYSLD